MRSKVGNLKLPIETLNDLKPTYQAEGYAVFRKDIPKEAVETNPDLSEFYGKTKHLTIAIMKYKTVLSGTDPIKFIELFIRNQLLKKYPV